MASSFSEPKRTYQVFLSFRGLDVRNHFLGHLYTALDQAGIHTYKDDEELRKGEQLPDALMNAIEDSRIAIIIFSKDYASSWWCLEELAKIMECRKQKDLIVWPVFYKVEPREVRTPRASYKKALAKQAVKFRKDSEKVNRWKKALFDATFLAGSHFTDGSEVAFIQQIVQEISTQLHQTPLDVAKYPVGIESRVQELKSILDLQAKDDVLMVGLWGQGGVGKTALAKAIYNAIFREFQGSSFLEHIRENSQSSHDVVSLQKKLLSEILVVKELTISTVGGGSRLIQERLCNKKVLIVLDDVDDEDQLDALAGDCEWFSKGSRIIITTRNKHVLTSHKVDSDHMYEVKALKDGEALELFRRHASLRNHQIEIRSNLVDSVLHYAKGLPLALQVLGSFLCGRGEKEWEETLKKLAESPNRKINGVLRVSYDRLENNEKEIFLDIACFFKGEDTEYIKKVLDSFDFHTNLGLQILIERSLISEDRGKLQMHDLIQSMGMDIVKEECRNDPGKRSRLWLHGDVLDVISRNGGTNATKAIVLKLPMPTKMHIGPDAFTNMSKLRLLILRNVDNSFQGPINLSNELTWLEWPCCASFPKFRDGSKKLVSLEMQDSKIKVGLQFKDFVKLKFINLSDCESLDYMPDVSCIPNLEELNLHGCKNLERVHNSVANHCNLWKLNLEMCYKLQRFPDISNKNKRLREVHLGWTSIEELPASIGNLVSLKTMYLFNCKKLAILPSSIYKLQNLRVLLLDGCSQLIKFPKEEEEEEEEDLSEEEEEDLSEEEEEEEEEEEDLSEPHTKTGFPMLCTLSLEGCHLSEVEFLENLSCPNLFRLLLSGNNFTNIPTLERLNDLEELEVSNCQQLQEIPKIPGKMRRLEANNCKSLTRIPSDICDIENVELYSSRELVCHGLPEKFHCQPNSQVVLPGGEMPKWLLPNKEGYISFMASKDLYEKILGVAISVVFQVEARLYEPSTSCPIELIGIVNGKGKRHVRHFKFFDLDNVWLEYMEPEDLWTVDHFSPNDPTHFHISIRVCNYNCGASDNDLLVKKCGFRLLCKPLENDPEVLLQDDQLLDPALFYEVLHEDNPVSRSSHGLDMVDFSIEKHRYSSKWSVYRNISPGREMPKGFVLVEDGTISFKALQDLYNKFVGLYLCVVFDVEDGESEVSFDIVPSVNGQRRNEKSGTLGSFDTGHVWFQFFKPNVLWGFLEGAVDFGQSDKSYLIFNLDIRVVGATVKRLGYVMQSDPLEDALKVELEKNRLMDPASLFEDDGNPWFYGSSGWKKLCKKLKHLHGGRDLIY